MKENYIEKKVCDHARTKGWLPLKARVIGLNGFPDRIFLGNDGRVLFVEFKAPGEAPRPVQNAVIHKLLTKGFTVHVIDSIEDGKQLFP